MAKVGLKEKEILKYLHEEGFKKVGTKERKTGWYKKASAKAECEVEKGYPLSHEKQLSAR
jgi:hypothetical protein